jgi:IS5 family transposase
MAVVADRLSIRWYLGYDLHEPLPDHFSLTRIRDRYGLAPFRRFFEEIVQKCIEEAGLVWGKKLYFDATKVEANASLESIAPHFAGIWRGSSLRRRCGPLGRWTSRLLLRQRLSFV